MNKVLTIEWLGSFLCQWLSQHEWLDNMLGHWFIYHGSRNKYTAPTVRSILTRAPGAWSATASGPPAARSAFSSDWDENLENLQKYTILILIMNTSCFVCLGWYEFFCGFYLLFIIMFLLLHFQSMTVKLSWEGGLQSIHFLLLKL